MIDNGVGLNTRALLLTPFRYGTESGEAILKCILLYSVKRFFFLFSTLNELLCIVYMIGIEHKAMLCRSCGWGTVWGGGRKREEAALSLITLIGSLEYL